jgi:hypothetical protein
MFDLLLIAVIVAFFVVGAVIVRLLDGMIARADTETEPGEEEHETPRLESGGTTS